MIRLNEPKYNKDHFEAKGIAHNDLFFVDGSNPPNNIVEGFFDVVENHFAN